MAKKSMKYTVPKLHGMNQRGHLACVSGSAAALSNEYSCQAGPNNRNLTGQCGDGANALWGTNACNIGTAAVGGMGACGGGNMVTNAPTNLSAYCKSGGGV